jgi:uncharacterized SAM-binding protein YcdF (DUF218 family)/lysophospholipase L1-like esterase
LFLAGVLVGIAFVFLLRFAINRTTLADWTVAPLLVSDTAGPADAMVVMGAGVIGSCTPNNNGVRRVLLAVRLWRAGRAPIVVFTGGGGGSCPVAVAMANFAREVGLPDAHIRVEALSRTTRENGERAAPLLHELRARRVLVVTDRLHMVRSAGTFTALGFGVERASVPIYEGHPNNVSMLTAAARESAAIALYWMRGWLGSLNGGSGPTGTTGSAQNPSIVTKMTTPVKNPNGPIVLLGASYARGWPLKDVIGIPVINRGIAGEQSFELLGRFERDVVAASARTVIVWGFINDIFRAAPADMEAAKARVRDSYTRMHAFARTHGIEMIVATEVTVRPADTWSEMVLGPIGWLLGKESNSERINALVMETNRWLTTFAEQEHLVLLDLQKALAEPGGRRRKAYAVADGSHISQAGYDALSAYAGPVLEAHLRAQGAGR